MIGMLMIVDARSIVSINTHKHAAGVAALIEGRTTSAYDVLVNLRQDDADRAW